MRKCETEDNFRGVGLARLVEYEPHKYWPTVTCQEVEHPDAELSETGRRLSKDGGSSHSLNLADTVMRAYPTPTCHDSKKAGSETGMIRKDGKDRLDQLNNFVKYGFTYPTPGTTGLSNGSGNCEKANELYEQGIITEEERRSFRAGNGGQLNPDWTEWLMGWPIGWTDLKPIKGFENWRNKMMDCTWWSVDPADVNEMSRLTTDSTHRADRLIAIGNGQVPMCVLMSVNLLEAV